MEQEQVVSNAVETYVVNVKFVKVIDNEKHATIILKLDKAIPGYVKNDDGSYVLTQVDTIAEFRSRLIAQVCELDELCAYYRGAIGHTFGDREATFVFQGSTLKINRTRKLQGELRENGVDVFERDCYVTDILELTIPKMGKQFIKDDLFDRK